MYKTTPFDIFGIQVGISLLLRYSETFSDTAQVYTLDVSDLLDTLLNQWVLPLDLERKCLKYLYSTTIFPLYEMNAYNLIYIFHIYRY